MNEERRRFIRGASLGAVLAGTATGAAMVAAEKGAQGEKGDEGAVGLGLDSRDVTVELGADDLLVLHAPGSITDETAQRLKEQMLDEDCRVLVLTGGMTYSIIKRPREAK